METIGDVLYGGIRPDIPGHGGQECASFLSKETMIFETFLSTTMMIVVGVFGYMTYSMPSVFPANDQFMKIGYKICSRELLYILNPCHVITIIEIYLLASKASSYSFSILRILIHYVYGALVAMMFPDTLSRTFPGEVYIYWIQHVMIFCIIPPYLIYIWGPQCLEPFTEWSWSCFAGIVFGVHNHYILQPVALLTHVNLNFVLCPSTVDPFNGPYYRTAAVFHQAVCLLTLGKLYTLLIKIIFKFLPKYKPLMKKTD